MTTNQEIVNRFIYFNKFLTQMIMGFRNERVVPTLWITLQKRNIMTQVVSDSTRIFS